MILHVTGYRKNAGRARIDLSVISFVLDVAVGIFYHLVYIEGISWQCSSEFVMI